MLRSILEQVMSEEVADSYSRPEATTNVAMARNASDEQTSPEAAPGDTPPPRESGALGEPAADSPPREPMDDPERLSAPGDGPQGPEYTAPPGNSDVGSGDTESAAPPSDRIREEAEQVAPPRDRSDDPDPSRLADNRMEEGAPVPPPPADREQSDLDRRAPPEWEMQSEQLHPVDVQRLETELESLGDWDQEPLDEVEPADMEAEPADDMGFSSALSERFLDT